MTQTTHTQQLAAQIRKMREERKVKWGDICLRFGIVKSDGQPDTGTAYQIAYKNLEPGIVTRDRMNGEPEEATVDMVRLMDVMQRNHRGIENAVKRPALLAELYGVRAPDDISNNNVLDRKLRRLIEDVNHDHNGVICSDPSTGFYWASDLKEGLDAVGRAKSRALTMLENAAHLERNLQREFGGQLTMSIREERA